MGEQRQGSQEEQLRASDSGGQDSLDWEAAGITVIIPMKPLSDSKSRLSKNFSREEKEDLALGLLRRVIGAVKAASVGILWVVGGDTRIRNLTRNAGGIWHEEAVYFTSKRGGGAAAGYVFEYFPRREKVRVIYESPGHRVFSGPDNINMSPRGNLVICEDRVTIKTTGQSIAGISKSYTC